MNDSHVPGSGGAISSKHDGTNAPRGHPGPPRARRGRPVPLALGKARNPSSSFDLGPKKKVLDCGICSESLSPNPTLCECCQVWNDARHVFQCLRNSADFGKSGTRLLEDLLACKSCAMCQEVSNAVFSRFGTFNEGVDKELLTTEITISGPYCMGQDAILAVDPSYFEGKGHSRIETDDLRLPYPTHNLDPHQTKQKLSQIRTVLYVVVTAPRGSYLQKSIPELDSYPNETYGPHLESQYQLGVHRVTPEGGPGLLQPTIGIQLTLRYGASMSTLSAIERWESLYVDMGLLQNWLHVCKTAHRPRCEPVDPQLAVPKGFRAIDTSSLCVVELPSTSELSFAALSYTWGPSSGAKELQLEKANLDSLQRHGSLKHAPGIPDLIQDAITLCQDLGQRYLWVDRLCIVQDDSASKYLQIQAMDRIYNLATFTIVGAVAPGIGLPGVRGRPRKSSLWNHTRRFHNKTRIIGDNLKTTVTQSYWNTRGWTFQERILSRRCIYITEFQTYFLCNSHAQQEDIGDFAAMINPWTYNLPQYMGTVPDYTRRTLSFGADILNAFLGIGNVFARAMKTSLVYGLPERYLAQVLLWEYDETGERRNDAPPDTPSWCWAAWKGGIRWDLNTGVERLSVGTLVRFYIQDVDQEFRAVETEEVWFFKRVCLEILETLPAIDDEYPEMRFMPGAEASTIAWRACPHNPWEVPLRQLDDKACKLASKHPGALVFTTTTAFVSLQKRSVAEFGYNDEEGRSFVILDIMDDNGIKVGSLARLHHSFVEQRLDLETKHEIIVLAAAILREPSRYAQQHPTHRISGEMREPSLDQSPWYLHVMLVERDGISGLAQRIGIGSVEMISWKQCKPKWNTVVLA